MDLPPVPLGCLVSFNGQDITPICKFAKRGQKDGVALIDVIAPDLDKDQGYSFILSKKRAHIKVAIWGHVEIEAKE